MKRRHIEITAFRRRVTVTGDVTSTGGDERPRQSDDDRLSSTTGSVLAKCIDPSGTRLTTIDTACSPELLALVEAFLKSNGDSALAAQELRLSRSSFYSRLRKLGLSLSQLRGQLNTLRLGLIQRITDPTVEKR